MKHDEYVIEVEGLSKRFNHVQAVSDLSLKLKRGEILGFLGPNGSGKTTTIRMLCGLLVPDAGTGHCLNFDILKQADRIKLEVGYMTQRFGLYEDLTIRENLNFIASLYNLDKVRDRIDRALENLNLAHRQHQLAGNLSGGWKQRLALAAALLHDPKILLLDEPTAGVDPKARRDFWEQIHHFSSQGITTLVSTHYMDEAERCHRLAYIAYGHLLVQGTFEEMIASTQLVTWEVRDGDLFALHRQLVQLNCVEQVAAFGNVLHVSGIDEAAMEKALLPFQQRGDQQWRRIRPGLEDVFITLMTRAQKLYDQ